MESSDDKQWASKYLLDPLTAPEPSQETGPGTHFYPSKSSATSVASDTRSEVPKRKSVASVDVRPKSSSPKNAYPSPPASASPRANNRPARRQEAFSNFDGAFSPRQSTAQSSAIGTSTADTSEVPTSSTGRRRTSSLTQRYPGDQSHRPLDIIRKDTKAANRAPHLKKKQLVGPDTIDSLDTVGGGKYHHEGPYDATLLARNVEFMNSPVEAVSSTNEQTLRATPREKVLDSLRKHRPLDGVATVPSGMTDREGRIFHYEEGTDLMIEEGNYKRWPGVKYSPEDLKGKGEPSYSLEKALKDHKVSSNSHRRAASEGIELASRPRSNSGADSRPISNDQSYVEWENNMLRSNTTGRKSGGTLKKRMGSLRKKRSD